MIFAENTEGIFHDLDDTVYRKAPGVAQSDLKVLLKSPLHYWSKKNLPPTPSTPAQVFGTLLHAAALEPFKLNMMFAVKPQGMTFTTKEGKAWRDEQTKPIITHDDSLDLNGCATSVARHPMASRLITGSRHEVSVFKRCEETGMMLKGRCDGLGMFDDEMGIIDIKTTEDAGEDYFSRDIAKFGYWMQAAYYLDLTGASWFKFIAVEKSAPYAVNVFELGGDYIEHGRRVYKKQIAILKECLRTNTWPGYGDAVKTVYAPRWMVAKSFDGGPEE